MISSRYFSSILLLTFDVVTSRRNRAQIARLGLLIGMQLLAGHAQTSWYTLLLAALWAGFWGWQSEGKPARLPLRSLSAAWGRLTLAVLIGVALAAVQLFPTAEYLLQSQRASAVEYEVAMTYSFWPWRALSLLASDLFGSPVHGDYWGYGNFWEDAVYIGLLPLLLALGIAFSLKIALANITLGLAFLFWIAALHRGSASWRPTPIFWAGALYGGALAIQKLFQAELTRLTDQLPEAILPPGGDPQQLQLWIAIVVLGVVSGFWAIYGGLSSVAWTDLFTVIVMVFGGLLVSYLGLKALAGEK